MHTNCTLYGAEAPSFYVIFLLVFYHTYDYLLHFDAIHFVTKVKSIQIGDRSRVRPSYGENWRTQLVSVSWFYKLAFLYCLSSCVAAAEESVAFKGGLPEVSTRGDIATQNKFSNKSASVTVEC